MGWTSSSEWKSKDEMVKYIIGPSLGSNLKAVAHSTRGNTLWVVAECTSDTSHHKAGYRILLCVLLQSSGGEWGYKDMDESMGPCDTSCPVKYLDMVPDPGGYATEWRAKVRAANRLKATKSKIVVGMRVKLIGGCTVRGQTLAEPLKVVAVKPLVCESPFGLLTVRPSHIAEVLPAE